MQRPTSRTLDPRLLALGLTLAAATAFPCGDTLMVVARIHWQALRLWRKRVPFFTKPAPPETALTR